MGVANGVYVPERSSRSLVPCTTVWSPAVTTNSKNGLCVRNQMQSLAWDAWGRVWLDCETRVEELLLLYVHVSSNGRQVGSLYVEGTRNGTKS